MKIGIISMQRITNYGSFLQAYGLKKTIESFGHEVIFGDYKSYAPVVSYSRKSRMMNNLRMNAVFAWLEDEIRYRLFSQIAFGYRYRREFLPTIGVTYRRKFNEKVDVAVIGSDEVFNCLQDAANVGFSPMLFGQNLNTKKVISYAASFGNTTFDRLERYGKAKEISKYLSSFDAISVRDANSENLIKTLTNIEPVVNLDPVLISDYDLPQVDLSFGRYVVLYTYTSRAYSDDEKRDIIDFCRKNGKRLVSIGNAQDWVDMKIDADPFELLSYIKAADFIITDTFHGSVFSIKYNQNFVTIVRPDNCQKLGDLLSRLKKDERRIEDFKNLQKYYDNPPEFTETNQVIAEGKTNAIEFLRNNLSQ